MSEPTSCFFVSHYCVSSFHTTATTVTRLVSYLPGTLTGEVRLKKYLVSRALHCLLPSTDQPTIARYLTPGRRHLLPGPSSSGGPSSPAPIRPSFLLPARRRSGTRRISAAALELCGLELGGSWWRRSSSPASTSADLVSRARTPGLELGGSRRRNSARLGIGPAGRLPPRHLPPKNRPGGHAARRLRPSSGRALLPPRPPPLLLS